MLFVSALFIVGSYAGSELINNVFGFPKFWLIMTINAVVVIYSYFGGIRAAIQTDSIQFVHFAVLIPVLALLMIVSDNFSWQDYQAFTANATDSAIMATNHLQIIGLAALWLIIAPRPDFHAISRYLASKNDHTAKKATLMAGGS